MMGSVTDETTDSTETEVDPVAAPETEPAAPPRRLGLLLSVATVVLLADVVTKVLAVKMLTPGQPVPIIGDTVTWTLVRNSGAAFSMATSYTWVLT
ncbi:signal peptidase II, partial [Mycolicibacter heraklionensis]|uniref:signal peptidase II n=1 Tax=Mycolicibacter heraklionensis TaxID=512402 RepID=UPI001A958BE0